MRFLALICLQIMAAIGEAADCVEDNFESGQSKLLVIKCEDFNDPFQINDYKDTDGIAVPPGSTKYLTNVPGNKANCLKSEPLPIRDRVTLSFKMIGYHEGAGIAPSCFLNVNDENGNYVSSNSITFKNSKEWFELNAVMTKSAIVIITFDCSSIDASNSLLVIDSIKIMAESESDCQELFPTTTTPATTETTAAPTEQPTTIEPTTVSIIPPTSEPPTPSIEPSTAPTTMPPITPPSTIPTISPTEPPTTIPTVPPSTPPSSLPTTSPTEPPNTIPTISTSSLLPTISSTESPITPPTVLPSTPHSTIPTESPDTKPTTIPPISLSTIVSSSTDTFTTTSNSPTTIPTTTPIEQPITTSPITFPTTIPTLPPISTTDGVETTEETTTVIKPPENTQGENRIWRAFGLLSIAFAVTNFIVMASMIWYLSVKKRRARNSATISGIEPSKNEDIVYLPRLEITTSEKSTTYKNIVQITGKRKDQ